MKRFFVAMLTIAMAFVFVSCEDKVEPPKEYTVTFNTNGKGEAPAVQKIVEGQKATRPEDPAAVGYTFGGWFKEETCTNLWDFDADTVTSNATIYAKWKEKNFTVTFDKNGHGTAPAAAAVQEGQKVAEPEALTAVGYTFGGWFRDAECTTEFDFDADTITSDITLYAKWALNTYTFSYVMNDHGSAVDAQTVSHGSKATKPSDPTDDNYAFWAWYRDEGCTVKYDFNTVITSDTTVYAKWTEKKTITYTTEFGTLSKDSDRVGLGLRITEPTAPSYSGYAFDGWYTTDDKLWNFTQDTVQGDMTLTAKWTLICSAVFNLNGHGEAIDSQDDLEAGKKVGKPEDPTAAGYVFGGWYTDAACEGKKWDFTTDTISTNPLNLYAKWTPKTVTVTLLKNSGTTNGSATATYGAGWTSLEKPVKSDIRIDGYYTDTNYATKVADGNGNLIANVSGYTDSEGKWIRLTDTNLYTRWEYRVTYVDPDGLLVNGVGDSYKKQGEKATRPPVATKLDAENGYEYRWSLVSPESGAQQTAYDFDTVLTDNITLYLLYTYKNTDNLYTVGKTSDGYELSSYNGIGRNVVVPSNIDGKRIRSIGRGTINGNSSVKSITISEGIEKINREAFRSCEYLTSISIPASVSVLASDFARFNDSLTTLTVSPESTYFKSLNCQIKCNFSE